MVIKVKVSDVARDFGKTNKEIIEILSQYCGGAAKKAGTVLEEDELNVLFDKITIDNSVKTLDAYFNSSKKKSEKKEEKKQNLKSLQRKRTKSVKVRPLFFRWQSRLQSVQRKKQRKRRIRLRRLVQRVKHAELIPV